MFVKAFFLCCIIAAVSASQEEFDKFKLQFGKVYATENDHQERYEIFKSNLQQIQEHNAKYDQGLVSWYKAVNQFSDLTTEEFKTRYLTLDVLEDDYFKNRTIHESVEDVPDKIDWRTKNYVTPVKNQGKCGSCWAFSATGLLEALYAKKNGKLIDFSEQDLVDCAVPSNGYFCRGCTSGIVQEALYYVSDKGIVAEDSYPYEGVQGSCRQDGSIFTVNNVINVQRYNEDDLKNAVGSQGPVSVAVNCDDIKDYGGGIYNNQDCSTRLNHAMLAVGYDSEDGVNYWIVKNTWSTTWGEKGYIRMEMGKNLCGISQQACYAVI